MNLLSLVSACSETQLKLDLEDGQMTDTIAPVLLLFLTFASVFYALSSDLVSLLHLDLNGLALWQ